MNDGINEKVSAPGCLLSEKFHQMYVKNHWWCSCVECPRHKDITPKQEPVKPSTRWNELIQQEFDF